MSSQTFLKNRAWEKETAVVEPIMTIVVFFNLRLMLMLQLSGEQLLFIV